MPSERARLRMNQASSTEDLDSRPQGQRSPPKAAAKIFRPAARRCFDTAGRWIPTEPASRRRVAEEASKSLGQAPFDPRDVFSVGPIRGQEFEARHAISTRDRPGFPPNRRLVLERAFPMDADDQGVRLRAQGKGLEDLDRTVVTEEAVAQDLEVVEERRGHGELDALHRRMVDR